MYYKKVFSLKKLLAGRLHAGGVSRKTTGTVSNNIPGVVAGSPWKRRSERVEEIIKSPAHEDIVVCREHKGKNHCGHTHTCEVTQQEVKKAKG